MRKPAGILIAAAAVALLVTPALTRADNQPPPMSPEEKAEMEAMVKAGTPGAPHQALASIVGEYDMKIKSWHDSKSPAMEETGTAKRAMTLDGRVLVEDVQSSMMGTPFTGHGMTGYDNVTGKYWSTWNDSMSTGLMVSEGTCDAQGKNCTFTGRFTDPIKKAPMKTRMTTRWPSPRSSRCTARARTARK
jgi:Protein of unknown function (DUF1579)